MPYHRFVVFYDSIVLDGIVVFFIAMNIVIYINYNKIYFKILMLKNRTCSEL